MSEGGSGSASVSKDRQDDDQHQAQTSEPVARRAPWERHISLPEPLRILTNPTDGNPITSTATVTTLKLPRLSPDTAERVFPISSVVSLDSTSSSALQTPALEKLESQNLPSAESHSTSLVLTERSPGQPVAPASTIKSTKELPQSSSTAATGNNERPVLVASVSDKGLHGTQGGSGASSDVVNALRREGPKDIQSVCSELQDPSSVQSKSKIGQLEAPFSKHTTAHTPNATEVLSFGALVVLKESYGRLIVQLSSRNTKEVLGYTPEELFELENFCDIIRAGQKENFLSCVSLVKGSWYDVEQYGPQILDFHLHVPCGMTRHLWCTMHAPRADTGHIVCEFEPVEVFIDPWQKPEQQESRSAGSDAGDTQGKPKEKDNTPGLPLEIQQMLRRIKGNSHSVGLLNVLSLVTQLARSTSSLSTLFNYIIGIIREVTGFNRATIYRFDHEWNAVPVADAVDQCVIPDVPKDQHFPKPLSPQDLDKLNLRKKVSLEYSHREPGSGLVCRNSENSSGDVDLGHCYLLSKSPDLVDHVTGIPVYARMSINITSFGRAWGLILCQSYEKEMRLPPPIQKFCWLISDTLSGNIERLANTLPFQMQKLVSSPIETETKGSDSPQTKDILSLFNANYAASLILGETKILGKPIDSQEVLAFVEYLKMRQHNTILWSTDVSRDFADLSYPPGFKYITSLLHVPLSADGRDFITFFRTSRWKDNNPAGDNDNARFSGQVQGKEHGSDEKTIIRTSDGWNAIDLQKGSVLSLIYRAFTEVWQQKEAAMQSTQLMRLLLANCAHEFRTPLNAIINYLEIALDGSLSQETRESLSRSHSASKSLIFIINDLLDLTNAENGRNLIKDEIFDLLQTIHEASNIFAEEAKQKNVDLHVVQHSNLPPVLGDQRRVRQVITNLISNAIQHTSSSDTVTVESCILPDYSEVGKLGVEVAIHDTGSGMSEEAIEALFCELEQVSNADYLQSSQRCDAAMTGPSGESRNVLGLGLALVARIVRNMNGQLTAKSEEGQGSCFRIRMQFPLPAGESSEQVPNPSEVSQVALGKMRTDQKEDHGDDHPEKAVTEVLSGGRDKEPRKDTDVVKDDCSTSGYSTTTITSQPSPTSKEEGSSGQKEHAAEPSSERITADTKMEPSSPHHAEQGGQAQIGSLGQPIKAAIGKSDQDDSTAVSAKSPEKTGEPDPPREPEPQVPSEVPSKIPATHISGSSSKSALHILVAEDDPINSTILRKRLEKSGHTVHMTGNGKECASAFRENADAFDAVLMDLQMPIVDGIGSTKMIREFEQSALPSLSAAGSSSRRVPIFAVSASLIEKERQTYIDSGFDGWIMKPIDFRRVTHLLDGVHEEEARDDSIYKPGMWEKGGWFDQKLES